MRLNWGRGAALSALAAVTLAASAFAGAQDSPVKVDVNLKDADMLMATKTLTSKTGIQFLVEPSTEPFAKITLQIKDVTPDEAIRYICQAAGAEFRRDEHGVFIIGHHKDVIAPIAIDAPKTPAKKAKVIRKVRILKANASDVCDMIVNRSPLSPTKGFDQLRDFVKATSWADQPLPESQGVKFYGNGPTQSFRPTGVMPGRTSTLANTEMSNQISLPGSGESAGQGMGGGISGFGGNQGSGGNFGGNGGQGGLGGTNGGQGGNQNTQLQGGVGLVPEGIDFVTYDPTDNSLVVQGTEEAYTELLRTIDLFDRAPQQVLIKVEFITTTEGIQRDFGTEFQYQRGTINAGTSPGSFARSGDPVYFNYASGNVVSRLRALLTETSGKVVSAPILRTLNNQPASIQAAVTQYVFINQLAATGNVVVSVPSPYAITASTNLVVAPRINADNTITMFLMPSIQAFVGTSIGPDGQEFPNQTNQSINVVARVRNGETMVVGGLTSKSDSGSVNRVPVLSEIPIIGQFFRTNSRTRTDSELLIFVTPTIVDEDQTGNPGGP